MFRALTTLCTLVAFAPSALAQSHVCMTGIVQTLVSPTCSSSATHEFACGSVLLQSSAIDLNDYLGQNVRVQGHDFGPGCPEIEVTTIGPARTTLTVTGDPRLGNPIEFVVCPVLQGGWSLWVSATPGYFPLACALIPNGLDGVLGLGPPVFWLAGGVLATCGEFTLTLPMNPDFLGLDLYFQGSHQFVAPVGPLEFSNVSCFRITA